jgi:O-antigen/teichoic acid export membrane protein
LINPLVPDAARASALANSSRVRELLVRGTKYSNGLTLLLAVPAVFFAKPLLVGWAGNDFGPAASSLQVLALSLLANNNHLVAFALLTGLGRISAYLRYQLIWAAANVVISLVSIDRIGLVGVALGTALPVVILEPLYLRTAIRETGVDGRRFLTYSVIRPIIASAVPTVPLVGAVLAWHDVSFLGAFVMSIGYAAMFSLTFYLLNIDEVDRQLILRTFRLSSRIRGRGRRADTI